MQNSIEPGRLMHDLHCKDAKDMYSKVLAEWVRELKETEKGVYFMCRVMEEIYSEGMEIGERKKARETEKSLSEMGLSVEKIAKAVKLSVPEIQKWIDESVSGQ